MNYNKSVRFKRTLLLCIGEVTMRELIRQKIIDAQTATILPFTRRTIYVPKIKGKATAVIGPRRGGKTTFLWQTLADRVAAGTDRAG